MVCKTYLKPNYLWDSSDSSDSGSTFGRSDSFFSSDSSNSSDSSPTDYFHPKQKTFRAENILPWTIVILTKLQDSNCDKTQNNLNFDKTQQLKLKLK